MIDPRIVALLLVKSQGDRAAVSVVPVDSKNVEAACVLAFESGNADVIGALTQSISASYAATFVPGIARCPEVAYLIVREEDKRAFDKENAK